MCLPPIPPPFPPVSRPKWAQLAPIPPRQRPQSVPVAYAACVPPSQMPPAHTPRSASNCALLGPRFARIGGEMGPLSARPRELPHGAVSGRWALIGQAGISTWSHPRAPFLQDKKTPRVSANGCALWAALRHLPMPEARGGGKSGRLWGRVAHGRGCFRGFCGCWWVVSERTLDVF